MSSPLSQNSLCPFCPSMTKQTNLQWKPCTVIGNYLEIINMLVTLFCHGRAEWTLTVLALRGRCDEMTLLLKGDNILAKHVNTSTFRIKHKAAIFYTSGSCTNTWLPCAKFCLVDVLKRKSNFFTFRKHTKEINVHLFQC